MKLRLMKPKDEISINIKIKCPLERINHKKIFGNFFLESSCHFHQKKKHLLHHCIFCFLFCKNYKFMIKKYKEFLNLKQKK
tara:strand:+ start:248 stop:490 length:243 start_codon:yes stop_codon:yes gene_type:complete